MLNFSKFTKKAEALSEKELIKLVGAAGGNERAGEKDSAIVGSTGNCDCSCDSRDVSSELASGGGTTDTYE